MKSMEEIYKILGIDPDKIPEDTPDDPPAVPPEDPPEDSPADTPEEIPAEREDVKNLALYIKSLYDAFVDAGFYSDEAFDLTRIILKKGF